MADDKKATNIRIDSKVLDAIDARAKDVGLSRTEWIEKCCRWALHNLPYGASREVKIKAAIMAPDDVKGTRPVDMGLDEVEQK